MAKKMGPLPGSVEAFRQLKDENDRLKQTLAEQEQRINDLMAELDGAQALNKALDLTIKQLVEAARQAQNSRI